LSGSALDSARVLGALAKVTSPLVCQYRLGIGRLHGAHVAAAAAAAHGRGRAPDV